MAKRSKSASDPAAGAPTSGGGMRWLTLLLAAYAATMGTLAYSRAGARGGAADASKDGLEARFAAEASRIRTEIQGDLDGALKKNKEAIAAETKRATEEKNQARTMKEAIEGQSEAAAQAMAKRSEVLDARIDDMSKETTTLKGTIESIDATVRELKTRPIAAAPVARDPAPVKPTPPTAPTPTAPDTAQAGPTPEEAKKIKDKVRALIKDLLDGLAANDVSKVFGAASKLGDLGDLEAVEPLLKVVKEFKDLYGRTSSISALGKLHACDAVPALLGLLVEKDDSIVLQAAQAFSKITGLDTMLSGGASRKDRNEAKERGTKWWKEHETEVRAKWNQPVGGAPPVDDTKPGDGADKPAGMDGGEKPAGMDGDK